MNKKKATKSALALSMFLMIFWMILGAGTSIAWFMDETPVAKNTFDIGIIDLEVYHKKGNDYQKVTADTKIFDDEAIYEPGYTQVVRLKIENKGTMDFDYKVSVVPNNVTTAKNVYGGEIYLPDHLRFGVVTADTETALEELVADRAFARNNATLSLSTYSESLAYETEANLAIKTEAAEYAAIIVWMPETVGNEANYRDNQAPQVELGINVKATQQGIK